MEYVSVQDTKLLICVPTYDGKIPVDWVEEIIQVYKLAEEYQMQVAFVAIKHGALIASNRNHAIRKMKELEADYMLQIDSDILFKAEDVFQLLGLAVHGKYGVIAAPYPRKEIRPDGKLACNLSVLDKTPNEHGLFKSNGVGTGFFMVSKEAIAKLEAAYPELQYQDPVYGNMYALFDTGVFDKKYYGEDILFCKRWCDLGEAVMVTHKIRLGHIGNYIYQFKPDDVIVAITNKPNQGV